MTLVGVRKVSVLLSFLLVLMTSATTRAENSDYKIIINVPATTLALYKNNEFVMDYKVAVGAPGYKTPIEAFYFDHMIWNPSWSPPDSPWARGASPAPPGPNNPLGPVKFPMQNGLRIHGTNKPGSIGYAASHGCIRMNNEDAAKLGQYIQSELLPEQKRTWANTFSKNRGSSYPFDLPQKVHVYMIYEPVSFVGNMMVEHPNVYGRPIALKDKLIDHLLEVGIYSAKLPLDKIKDLSQKKNHIYLPELLADAGIEVHSELLEPVCKQESKKSIYENWLKKIPIQADASEQFVALNEHCGALACPGY